MALEALSSSELLNFIIYDTIFSAACTANDSSPPHASSFLIDNAAAPAQRHQIPITDHPSAAVPGGDHHHQQCSPVVGSSETAVNIGQKQRTTKNLATEQGGGAARKKRRRRQRVCKNKEEAENQRMTHIAVERNRRKQMNEHLAVLRTLMPETYVQRGDQASIVGGAIEFVKELEHHLQSLQAHKFKIQQQRQCGSSPSGNNNISTRSSSSSSPLAEYLAYPQYSCSPNKYTSKSKAAVADIEVTLIETHANVRILSRTRLRQLSKMVTAFHKLYLSILHLNVTTLDPLVLYSISAKVEEGCLLKSADDIAGAVHHILRIIEEEANLCCEESSIGPSPTC